MYLVTLIKMVLSDRILCGNIGVGDFLEIIRKKFSSATNYVVVFIKWFILAAITGFIGGAVGTLFHVSVEWATSFRTAHSWIIFLLPIGGVIIAAIYHFSGYKDIGTNEIIDAVRTPNGVPFILTPLIFLSTVITHLCGGSAGREGAALQLGGSIANFIGKITHLDEKDMHIITLCGMSAVFSALFGTPLTAAIFALGVISVGVIYYAGLLPCIVSAYIAYFVSIKCGTQPVHFTLSTVPELTALNSLRVIALSLCCAILGIVFCLTLHKTHHAFEKYIKNPYLRAIVGAVMIILLSLIWSSGDYNGAGMNIVERAIGGEARPEAFIIKLIFTAITVGAGFKGGEIVPTFFVGATFGCTVGALLGLDAGFGAAIGLVALFCAVVNCPIASIFLSIEIFGSEGMLLFALAVSISYLLSGYYGLYSSQKIVYSKLRAEVVNINAK